MDQPWKSKHCVRLRIPHCWVHCSHGRCLGKKIPFLNLTPWQCCGVLRWAWFLVITPNYYFSSTTSPTGHIPIEWIQVCHQVRYFSLRYLLDLSVSLHLMVIISVLATAGISLISPHLNVPSHHAATPSVHTAAEKLSCSSVWFLMMCFLVMWGWRAQFLVLQRLLQDRSWLSPSSVLNGLRLPCLLGLLSLRSRHCPSLPPPLRFSLPGTRFLILSSDLAQWLLLQGNPWIFFAKVFVLILFQFSQLHTLSTTHCDSHPGYILTSAHLAVIIWLVCVSPTKL